MSDILDAWDEYRASADYAENRARIQPDDPAKEVQQTDVSLLAAFLKGAAAQRKLDGALPAPTPP